MSDDLEILLKVSLDDDNKLTDTLNKQISDLSLKLDPIKIGIDLGGSLGSISSDKLKGFSENIKNAIEQSISSSSVESIFNLSDIIGQYDGILKNLKIAYNEQNEWTGAVLETLDGLRKVKYLIKNDNDKASITGKRVETFDILKTQNELQKQISEIEKKSVGNNEALNKLYQERLAYLKSQIDEMKEAEAFESTDYSDNFKNSANNNFGKSNFLREEAELMESIKRNRKDINENLKNFNALKTQMKEISKLEVNLIKAPEHLGENVLEQLYLREKQVNLLKNELLLAESFTDEQKKEIVFLKEKHELINKNASQNTEEKQFNSFKKEFDKYEKELKSFSENLKTDQAKGNLENFKELTSQIKEQHKLELDLIKANESLKPLYQEQLDFKREQSHTLKNELVLAQDLTAKQKDELENLKQVHEFNKKIAQDKEEQKTKSNDKKENKENFDYLIKSLNQQKRLINEISKLDGNAKELKQKELNILVSQSDILKNQIIDWNALSKNQKSSYEDTQRNLNVQKETLLELAKQAAEAKKAIEELNRTKANTTYGTLIGKTNYKESIVF